MHVKINDNMFCGYLVLFLSISLHLPKLVQHVECECMHTVIDHRLHQTSTANCFAVLIHGMNFVTQFKRGFSKLNGKLENMRNGLSGINCIAPAYTLLMLCTQYGRNQAHCSV